MKLWLLLLTFALPALAGHESHGSDNSVESLAWFLGEGREIKYCLESTLRFRIAGTEEEMRDAIEKTFKLWIDYIRVRQVNTNPFPKAIQPQITFADKLTWTKKPCTGTEDLTFYFGVDNALTREARARFDDPVALTYIPKFNPDRSWQKGFVWIANPGVISGKVAGKKVTLDWYEESDVMNVLLHEWGHIFGNGHIQGTVMDASLKQLLLEQYGEVRTLREPEIDGTKELYTLLDVREEFYVGTFSPQNVLNQATFLDTVGRLPEGDIKVQIHLVKPRLNFELSRSTFSIYDGKVGVAFPIEMRFNSPTIFLGEEVFRRRGPDGEVYFNRHSASAYHGVVHFPKNGIDRMYSISFETNTSVAEPAGGTSRDIQRLVRPVQGFMSSMALDQGRSWMFNGFRALPPSGSYELITPPAP